MPFDHPLPRSFKVSSVREYAPAQSGVYGISNGGRWVYVGETDNIQAALLWHLHERDTELLRHEPTGFVFEICDRVQRLARQNRLISEYEPVCNPHGSRHR